MPRSNRFSTSFCKLEFEASSVFGCWNGAFCALTKAGATCIVKADENNYDNLSTDAGLRRCCRPWSLELVQESDRQAGGKSLDETRFSNPACRKVGRVFYFHEHRLPKSNTR